MNKAITLNTIVIQKKDLPVIDLDGEVALMNTERGRYYSLDSIGSNIWTLMKNEITIKEIIARLLEEYDVSSEECERDVIELINQLSEQGLIEIS